MRSRRPSLSIIVIAHQMDRELPRTLHSLTPAYQGLDPRHADYEVLVMDNGSSPPFGRERLPDHDLFRYFYPTPISPSPARALNEGARLAEGGLLGFMIDGARIVTPGLVGTVRAAFRAFERAVVAVPGWHLGPDVQYRTVERGYDQAAENALLERIGWPEDGYRLFEIAVPAGSCDDGCLAPMSESNALFVDRRDYLRLGGFDERFDTPGGGLVNLDFYRRAVQLPGTEFVVLPGEGTFHQVHGGVSTNVTARENEQRCQAWDAQHERLTGARFARVDRMPVLFGRVPAPALGYLAFSASRAAARDPRGWRPDQPTDGPLAGT